MRYKVIQWATGEIGKRSLRALAERSEFDIVGCKVFSADKDGKDIGEICGIAPYGVKATMDKRKILDLDADVVLYQSFAEKTLQESLRDVCDLLASGKDVITVSTPFIYPKAVSPEFNAAIEQACAQGGSTFHGCGIQPGFVSEALSLMMTRVLRRLDQLVVYETLLYDTVPSKELMDDVMGFGRAPDDTTSLFANKEADLVGNTWRPSAMLFADALGIRVDEAQTFREVVTAPEDIKVMYGTIRKGTVAAQNFGVRLLSDGKPKVIFQHYTRMDPKLAPHWPSGQGWTLNFEGDPSMQVKVNIGMHGEDHNAQAYLGTAMHAIHNIPHVVAAKPGILTLAQIPAGWASDVVRTEIGGGSSDLVQI